VPTRHPRSPASRRWHAAYAPRTRVPAGSLRAWAGTWRRLSRTARHTCVSGAQSSVLVRHTG